MKYRFQVSDPPPREAHALAKRILEGNPLDARILQALTGRPHRYSDLRPLSASKGDETLNRALRRLVGTGVLDQRTDVAQSPPVDSYELSDLGIRVVLALAGRRAIERLVDQATESAAAHA